MPSILVSRRDGVGTIRLSNPARFNAMTLAMWQDLPSAIADLDADDAVRVVVVEGDGDKAFVSGSDISEFASQRGSVDTQRVYNAAVDDGLKGPAHCSKPVVAKIRGHCIGGGV